MGKKYLIIMPLVLCVAAAVFLFKNSEISGGYYGLPVVSCIDPTKPIVQDFSFSLQININGQSLPLDPAIGHDPGHCLRVIHTNDSSGEVFVQSNDSKKVYTLEEFFNVWHKNYTPRNFLGRVVDNAHIFSVYSDGKVVPYNVELKPQKKVQIFYK